MQPLQEQVLKRNPNRTVLLERAATAVAPGAREPEHATGRKPTCRAADGGGGQNGAWHAVKRFHARGPLRRLADRGRAQRELRALCRARELGLPVPRPIELRRRAGRWELVTEFIPDALTLEDCLARPELAPLSPERLAEELARLFAAIAGAGLEHLDLHPGNVLVDRAGALWLLDLAHASFGSPPDARALRQSLIVLAAEVRDRSSARFRARFLLRLLAHLPLVERAGSPERSRLAAGVEAAALVLRRETLRGAVGKWLRDSGATRRLAAPLEWRAGAGAPLVARAELEAPSLALALELLDSRESARELVREEARWLAWPRLERARAEGLWSNAVRLELHALAGARPLLRSLEERPAVVLELPPDSRPALDFEREAAAGPRRRAARALGRWLARLHARGLALAESGLEVFQLSGDGRRAFGCLAAPLLDANDARRVADRAALDAAARSPLERRAFLAAYARASHFDGARRRAAARRSGGAAEPALEAGA